MNGVLIRRGEDTGRHIGKEPYDNEGRDWSHTATSQGMPRTASHLGKGLQREHSPDET